MGVISRAQAHDDGRDDSRKAEADAVLAQITAKESAIARYHAAFENGTMDEEVFTYVTDPSRFGEWQSGVISGHIEGDGPASVGSKCMMTRRIGGSERTSTSEITPPRTWAIRGIDGPIRADVNVVVEPRQDGGQSHVTIQLDFQGFGIGKMLVPMVVRQARREVPQSCQNLRWALGRGEHHPRMTSEALAAALRGQAVLQPVHPSI